MIHFERLQENQCSLLPGGNVEAREGEKEVVSGDGVKVAGKLVESHYYSGANYWHYGVEKG